MNGTLSLTDHHRRKHTTTRGATLTSAGDRWEALEKIGAYAAEELSGEEAKKTARLVLEDPPARRLADSYAEMLTLLRVVSEARPEPHQEIVALAEHAV